MKRKLLIITMLAGLLLCTSAFAQKDYTDGMAAETCDSCIFEFGYLTILPDASDSASVRTSTHGFNLSSDGNAVSYLELLFRVGPATTPFDTMFVEVSEWLIDTASVVIDTHIYFHDGIQEFRYRIEPEGDDVRSYTNEQIFSLQVRMKECTSTTDTTYITLFDSSGVSQYNSFVSGGTYYPANLWGGYRAFSILTFVAEISLLRGRASGTDVVTSYVGADSLGIPIWIDTLNFDYNGGYEFDLEFDSELDFHSIITHFRSGNATATNETDNSVHISATSSTWEHSESGYPLSLMTVNFNIEPDADPDQEYALWIEGDYNFYFCSNLYVTDNNNGDYVDYRTVDEAATWHLPTKSIAVDTEDAPLEIEISNNAPIWTNKNTTNVTAVFTWDHTTLSKISYTAYAPQYPVLGGTFWWVRYPIDYEDAFFYREKTTSQSVDVPPASHRQIGTITVDANHTGTDALDFVTFEDPEHNEYREGNKVLIKHTGNYLRAIDSTIYDTVYYGALSLDSGVITVYTPDTSGGGGGCPELRTWHGTGWVLENTILTHSQGMIDPQPQSDFYPVGQPVVAEEGFYKFKLMERENEITFLDNVELIAVDYPYGGKIGISNEGQVFCSEETYEPIAAVDKWGRDLMPYLGKLDNVWMDVDYPGSMVVTYRNPNFDRGKGRSSSGSFALGGTPEPPGGKKMVTVGTTGGVGDNLFAEIEDTDGHWYYLGSVPPREFQSENSKWVVDPAELNLGETFRVRVTWKTTYQADLQALYVGNSGSFVEHRIGPEMATHSVVGKIPVELVSTDGDITTLQPGETIELKFAVPDQQTPEGWVRKFFFKSHGYYKTFKQADLLPDKFVLGDNYPNPFNPSTTIDLAIPVSTDISLTVVNVLGQEVKTIYNGFIEAGNHKMLWEGDNGTGEPVASGVYFYRLQSSEFTASKKMILMK